MKHLSMFLLPWLASARAMAQTRWQQIEIGEMSFTYLEVGLAIALVLCIMLIVALWRSDGRTSSVPVKLSRKEMLHESAILHCKNDTRQALSLMPKQVTLTRTRHHRTGKKTYCTMRDLKHRMITHRQNLKDLLPLS